MTSPAQVVKSVGPKLVPFFKTVAIYFVLCMPVERPSWMSMIIKCLPIVSLQFFVLLHGMSLGDEYAYSRRILAGLLLSSVGDALLIWPDYFIPGMAAFGVAHLFYINAFGFKPFNASLGAVFYAFTALAMTVIIPGLSGILQVMVPLYSMLLSTMAWRATARVQFFKELWTWTKLCSCLGGILFVISDYIIALNEFHHSVSYAQVLIMITYYAAQLGIALSVVDSKDSYRASMAIK